MSRSACSLRFDDCLRKSTTIARKTIFWATILACASSSASAQWSAEVKLSTDEGSTTLNENVGHCLVVDGDSVHVVWADQKNNGQAIFYRRSVDKGLTWEADARISASPSSDTFPLLAQSGSTLHLVLLRDFGTDKSTSYYKRSTDGGKTWGPDVLLGKTKWWPGLTATGKTVFVALNAVTPDDAANSAVFFRRSTDDGLTWEPQEKISDAAHRQRGRSEDPAIMASEKVVHAVWNDNRDAAPGKGMAVYYRRSADLGTTWGPETALSHAPEFTYFPTISLSGANANVAYGDRQSGHFNIFMRHSDDFGETWGKPQQLSDSATGSFYPAVATDGANIHVVWMGKEGITYRHSTNHGTDWEPAVRLTEKGGTPFIAIAGDILHVIYTSQRDGHGAVYYLRNPTGNKAK